jgi:hypothetical protein
MSDSAAKRARRRNREHLKRSATSDITAEQELAMRLKARNCPLCGIRMRDQGGKPDSKELDHIIPINVGGTHTHGNVRIICRLCNQRRPKDGSDYSGPVTLWAQGETLVRRSDRRSESMRKRMSNVDTCRKGLHPWVAENIGTGSTGKKYCLACRKAIECVRNPLRPCAECGIPASMQGGRVMCPACTDSAVRQAIELRMADKLTWNEIAQRVGYGSATGILDAAKRTGWREPVGPKPAPQVERPCPECGKTRAKRAQWCEDCTTAKAWHAVETRRAGSTLRQIADELGYDSITSVTSLMKTVVTIESRMGRPLKLPA